jgi:hypothetical protein
MILRPGELAEEADVVVVTDPPIVLGKSSLTNTILPSELTEAEMSAALRENGGRKSTATDAIGRNHRTVNHAFIVRSAGSGETSPYPGCS